MCCGWWLHRRNHDRSGRLRQTVNATVSNAYDASAPSSPRMHRTGSRRIRWPHAERTSASARSWRRRLHHVLRCTSEAAAAHLRRLEASSIRLRDPVSAKVGQAHARRSAASHARTWRADPLPSTSTQALTASVRCLGAPSSRSPARTAAAKACPHYSGATPACCALRAARFVRRARSAGLGARSAPVVGTPGCRSRPVSLRCRMPNCCSMPATWTPDVSAV